MDKLPHPEEDLRTVPNELMDKLHEANQKFGEARKDLEEKMDASEYRHQERVNESAARIREIEKQVEEVSEQISKKLHAEETSQDEADQSKAP